MYFSVGELCSACAVCRFSSRYVMGRVYGEIGSVELDYYFSRRRFTSGTKMSVIAVGEVRSYGMDSVTLDALLGVLHVDKALRNIINLIPRLPSSPFLVGRGGNGEVREVGNGHGVM